MNILAQVRAQLKQEIAAAAVRACLINESQVPEVVLETPRHKTHGDFATNLAMQLTKSAQKPPRQIAELIAENIDRKRASIEKIEIAGPGFINLFMDNSYLQKIVPEVLAQGEDYGCTNSGAGEKVLVEYVSANPTGDLHVGHARGAAVGDALCNTMAMAGYEVNREFYINDAGNQMHNLALSLEARYMQALGQDWPLPESGYHGQDIVGFAADLLREQGDKLVGLDSAARLKLCREYGLKREQQKLRDDLAQFRVEYDHWFAESSLYQSGKITDALDILAKAGLTYEHEDALWFKSTDFGDDKDRVLIKKDGSYTYIVPDIAYHREKMERGYQRLINIWGADHHGYIPRMQAAMQALGYQAGQLEILVLQMVNLLQNGEKVKMSKRTGKAVTLRDLMEEVGTDATRYFLTMLSPDSHMDFDMDLAVSQSNDNPVYYVQYAHARICSMLRNAAEQGFDDLAAANLARLDSEREFDLLKKLGEFPDVVTEAAKRLSPHTVSYYVFDLASQLHSFYNAERVIDPEDMERTRARLALVAAIGTTINNALTLLGVSAPEQM